MQRCFRSISGQKAISLCQPASRTRAHYTVPAPVKSGRTAQWPIQTMRPHKSTGHKTWPPPVLRRDRGRLAGARARAPPPSCSSGRRRRCGATRGIGATWPTVTSVASEAAALGPETAAPGARTGKDQAPLPSARRRQGPRPQSPALEGARPVALGGPRALPGWADGRAAISGGRPSSRQCGQLPKRMRTQGPQAGSRSRVGSLSTSGSSLCV